MPAVPQTVGYHDRCGAMHDLAKTTTRQIDTTDTQGAWLIARHTIQQGLVRVSNHPPLKTWPHSLELMATFQYTTAADSLPCPHIHPTAVWLSHGAIQPAAMVYEPRASSEMSQTSLHMACP